MDKWRMHLVVPGDLDRIDRILREWEPIGGCGGQLQAGDVGWAHRFRPESVAASLVEWRSPGGEPGAIHYRDSPMSGWFSMDPGLVRNRDLANEIAAWAAAQEPEGLVSVDGHALPAIWRQALMKRGFEATTDVWAHLWKPLSFADVVDVAGVEVTTGNDQAIVDRVAVQKAAFENSTFTVEKWHALAQGPSFRPGFDLLARDEAGEAVAAITVWLPGEGKCGMIEPMGTHPDHRRLGHGRRVIRAACAALARAGASGVCVVTPESNAGAVEVYRAAGLRRLGQLSAMVRPV